MDRHERMRVEFSIPYELVGDIREHLDVLRQNAGLSGYERAKPGDTVNLGYTFDVEYIGRIVESLTAVHEIATRFPELITGIDELIHGRSVIQEVLNRIDRIQQARKA